MRVMPTLDGGLRIDVETATDWLVLEQIAPDALQDGTGNLPERLGALMDDDSEWDELVIPELRNYFSGQLRTVTNGILQAQREAEADGEGSEGELFIPRADGSEWYGALNQARLALESRFRFGPALGVTEIESFPASKRSAYIRSQFYCALQTVLLEHVLE